MDSSSTMSFGGPRVTRAALLATTATGTNDRRVVFLGSSPNPTSNLETRTWPHNWSPSTAKPEDWFPSEQNYKSLEVTPHVDYKSEMLDQGNWPESSENSTRLSVQNRAPAQSASGNSTKTYASEDDKQHHIQACNNVRIGVYGWRKKCLYSLILGLMIMVILNLGLTMWLLKVMEFSSEGIGSMRILPSGIELRGQAAILDSLIASTISSRRGKNLMLESWSNFTATARAADGHLAARFTLSERKVDCISESFQIRNPHGEILFSADREQVVVGAALLKVTGVGGAVFQGSVQTPLVRSESGFGLRLESATRALEIRAPERIVVESRAGEILASSLSDLTLQSIEGAIKLDAKNIIFKGLEIDDSVQTKSTNKQQQYSTTRKNRSSSDEKEASAYQLCACANGKLFLAKPEGICQTDNTIC